MKMEERIKATILGNCIGDAMGNISQYFSRNQAHQLYAPFSGEMTYDLKQVVGERTALMPGYWTENSDLMLLIIQSLDNTEGIVSGVNYGRQITLWTAHGFQELTGKPSPRLGTTTLNVLRNPAFVDNPHKAAHVVWSRNGSVDAPPGAVMKTAILGLYMSQDSEIVTHNTLKICKVTHSDPRCKASCVAVTTTVAAIMQNPPTTDAQLEDIIKTSFVNASKVLVSESFKQYVPELKKYMFAKDLKDLAIDRQETASYTFTTLAVGFWALRQHDFREAIEAIVLEGGDASANAALAGALLGCKLGLQAIPTPWMEQLLKKDWLDVMINKFTQIVKSPSASALEYFQQQKGLVEPAKPAHIYPSPLESVCDPMQRNILGVVYGHAIGDAIGLLTEFLTRADAQKFYGKYKGKLSYQLKELVGDRHRKAWLVGDWTDDTDQMVVIMESIIYSDGQVDVRDFAKRLKSWACLGFKELGDKMGNGLGATTKSVLMRTEFETNPIAAAQNHWEMSGCVAAPNGAVMRTSVLGIFMYQDIEAVIKNTTNICRVTHADPRCQASCVAVATAIAMMLQKKPENDEQLENLIKRSYEYAKETLEKLCATEHLNDLKKYMYAASLKDLQLAVGNSIGYTFKCLGAGFWALRQDDYRTALEAIVFEAGDADTNGAVAGALLGCKLGFKGLPQQWLDDLRYRKWLDDIIEQFLIVLQSKERVLSSKGGAASEAGAPKTLRSRPSGSTPDRVSPAADHVLADDDLETINMKSQDEKTSGEGSSSSQSRDNDVKAKAKKSSKK